MASQKPHIPDLVKAADQAHDPRLVKSNPFHLTFVIVIITISFCSAALQGAISGAVTLGLSCDMWDLQRDQTREGSKLLALGAAWSLSPWTTRKSPFTHFFNT